MHLIPKRLLLIGAAPLVLAAMYGGSLAFAQSGEDQAPAPSPTEDAAPAAPTTPDSTAPDEAPDSTAPRSGHDCANKGGGSGGSESTEPDTSTQIRTRVRNTSGRPF